MLYLGHIEIVHCTASVYDGNSAVCRLDSGVEPWDLGAQ